MKRIVLTLFVMFLAFAVAVIRPELASMANIQWVVIFMLAALVLSLVFMPVTNYIPFEKRVEVPVSSSFRYGINSFRDKQATFILHSGTQVSGILIGRSDAQNTYSIQMDEGDVRVIQQSDLQQIATDRLNAPPTILAWDEGGDPVASRSC